MLRKLARSECIHTAKFGAFCPYWAEVNGEILVADTADEIIHAIPRERRVVDPVAVLELLQFNYMLGDRTLVQGVQRMPWHATLRGDGTLERQKPLPHSSNSVAPEKAAINLYQLLSRELFDAAREYSRIFLLLSGGLDSRIVTGILKRLEPELKRTIVCVTWGQGNSRDVVYARRIASWYDWDFVHVPYDAELTWANIERGAQWGASEVAGLHLHGLNWFSSNATSNDLVVAASFGDGIGRAEFSSRHLTNLTPVPLSNTRELIHPSLELATLTLAEEDRATAWCSTREAPQWVCNELDMQENYMRRMICHAMDYVRQFCHLHQAFASDEVVSYMWSLAPACRTDDIYYHLLKDLDSNLYSLPWTRTGIAPSGAVESDPSLQIEYHQWGRWLRTDLRPRLESLLLSKEFDELGVLFRPDLRRVWRSFLEESPDVRGKAEIVVNLCSIELSRRYFELQPCRTATTLRDELNDLNRRGQRKLRRYFETRKAGIRD